MAKRKRPIDGFQRRYSWKLYLTPQQAETLRSHGIACVDLWNTFLGMCDRRYDAIGQRETRWFYDAHGNLRQTFTGRIQSRHCHDCAVRSWEKGKLNPCDAHKLPSYETMTGWITALRAESSEWREMSVCTPRRVARSLGAAWQAFFDRVKKGKGSESGPPRYKSHRNDLRIPYMCSSGCSIEKADNGETRWHMSLAAVPGRIWAGGRVPSKVNEWTEADVVLPRSGNRNEISFAAVVEPRREPWRLPKLPVTIRFDGLDCFATVNNESVVLDGLLAAGEMDELASQMRADMDVKWPRTKKTVRW